MQLSNCDDKSTLNHEEEYPKKGERIIFEGEIGYVIKVKPYLVIKTKNRVVCGALHRFLSRERVNSC